MSELSDLENEAKKVEAEIRIVKARVILKSLKSIEERLDAPSHVDMAQKMIRLFFAPGSDET
jgi:hypothetical protein